MSDDRLDDEPAHAPLGPSAAEGWATCSDYVNANAGLPDNPSFPAAEGTFAHSIGHDCAQFGFDARDFVGTTWQFNEWTFNWTDEDAPLLQRGLNRVRELMSLPGAIWAFELRVDISKWTIPGQFGTLDRAVVVLIDGVWWVFIIDLKWGRWPVYPHRNLQIILYALGFWNDVARDIVGDAPVRFSLEIDQPRCAGGGGIWETSLDELLLAGEWLKERAHLTTLPNPPRTASEKGCVWCRRKLPENGGCPTYEAFNAELIGARFEEEPTLAALVPSTVITPERRSFILSHKKMLTTWFELLEEQELADYLAGLPTPGRKGVTDTQKGKRAAWKNEKAAESALVPILGDKSFTKKLITPAQAVKQVSPEALPKISEHIIPGESGKSMVPLADARPALPVMTFDEEAEVGEDEK